MSFVHSLSDRIGPRSPTDENSLGQGFISNFQQPMNDTRASLQRRFTTDNSNKMSPFSPLVQQPQMTEQIDISSSTVQLHKAQLYEKKRQQVEHAREQRRKFEVQMKLLDLQQERDTMELDQISRELQRTNLGAVSEPTTPPEYRGADSGFSSSSSSFRPHRFSASNLTSPPSVFNRFATSASTHITSPPNGNANMRRTLGHAHKQSAKSMPGSRRNSEEDETAPDELVDYRSTASSNRYSMPVTTRNNLLGFASHTGLAHLNTTKFLFDEEDRQPASSQASGLTSPNGKGYLQMGVTEEQFPTLVRRDDNSGLLSANSAALDLANSRSPAPETWGSYTRHRPSHQSLPQNGLNMFRLEHQLSSPPSEKSSDVSATHSPPAGRQLHRHSLEVTLSAFNDAKLEQGSDMDSFSRPGSLQSSYSTNDIPTMKSTNGFGTTVTPPKTRAEQQFHNHNASLGRIPPNAVSNRQSRDMSTGYSIPESKREEHHQPAQHSTLQASAPPFGPQLSSTANPGGLANSGAPTASYSTAFQGYPMQSYGMPQMAGALSLGTHVQSYQPQNVFGAYQNYSHLGRAQDNQARIMHQRRLQNGEDSARFANVPLDNYRGSILALCKDQHGCRYLQRQLEERNPDKVQTIFLETHQHVIELMTDPFGNYLTQKLLEYANDLQRTALINNAASQMVTIALNQHGTRALQKMIEFISTDEQVQTIIIALRDRVVDLVQDLNGNHVIQKCLNRLSAEQAQFIFDAVGQHCVIVGTHRHGCCVLQRCIDHATGHQRANLIAQITSNAFALVQDPFGNYVVQYILDLAEPHFTKPLCLSFKGNVPALSKQKFSSNVVEKCLRTADTETQRAMIDEMLNANELERMLRDSFANYVVQTAMDYADSETKTRMVEAIRPILPAIRQTPHGRRIAGKILGSDGQGRLSGMSSGQITPSDMTSPGQMPSSRQANMGLDQQNFQFHNQNSFQNPSRSSHFGNQAFSNNGMNGLAHDLANTQLDPRGSLSDASATMFSPITTSASGLQSAVDSFGSSRTQHGFF